MTTLDKLALAAAVLPAGCAAVAIAAALCRRHGRNCRCGGCWARNVADAQQMQRQKSGGGQE